MLSAGGGVEATKMSPASSQVLPSTSYILLGKEVSRGKK